MRLLIDGYNLLWSGAVPERSTGPRTGGGTTPLARAREGMLRFLLELIPFEERSRTCVVFDAAGAPRGLPGRQTIEGVTVLFARDHRDADELLEELIEQSRAPRELTVVSSDHRVQHAGKRRKAAVRDSDVWILEALQARRARNALPPKPAAECAPGDVRFWMEAFGFAGGAAPLVEPVEEELPPFAPPPRAEPYVPPQPRAAAPVPATPAKSRPAAPPSRATRAERSPPTIAPKKSARKAPRLPAKRPALPAGKPPATGAAFPPEILAELAEWLAAWSADEDSADDRPGR